jgi:hypothetical protein
VKGLGVFLWRRSRKAAAAVAEEMVEFTAECDEADAEPVLAEVPSIVRPRPHGCRRSARVRGASQSVCSESVVC